MLHYLASLGYYVTRCAVPSAGWYLWHCDNRMPLVSFLATEAAAWRAAEQEHRWRQLRKLQRATLYGAAPVVRKIVPGNPAVAHAQPLETPSI